MKTETYFLAGLICGIVGLLSLLMVINPLFISPSDIGYFELGLLGHQPLFEEIRIYYNAVSFLKFLPSAYFCIGLTSAGIVKHFLTRKTGR